MIPPPNSFTEVDFYMPWRVGLLIPSPNSVMEVDFYRSLPHDTTLHTARMFMPDMSTASEEQMLDHQLPAQSPPCRSKRGSNRKLAAACRGAHGQQARDVQARDQQHGRDSRAQHRDQARCVAVELILEAQQLDDVRIAEHGPAAEHVLAVAQPLLEGIRAVHGNLSMAMADCNHRRTRSLRQAACVR
jgi:hypothetical protein